VKKLDFYLRDGTKAVFVDEETINQRKTCQVPILRGGDFSRDRSQKGKIQPKGLDKEPKV
jgi:hypothetical protein